MSTAGKVLIILFVLTTVVWIILASGVAQYDTNANTKLHQLVQQVEKLETDLKQTQDDIAAQRNETSRVQEDIDRTFTLLSERQVDIEKARSQISETLSHNQYQLETIQAAIKGAQTALENRNKEHEQDTTELARMRAEVKNLMADCSRLQDRLAALRKDFMNTYHANIELLGKAGRSDNARRGGTN
jgi:chromosome segregation ATPase